MASNPDLLAPCGLYCGVCGMYYATRDNNEKFLERLVTVYQGNVPGADQLKPRDLKCDGCLSQRKSIFCESCLIRDCTQKKGFSGCHECGEFPCAHITEFPIPVGKKVIMRANPYRRKHGTDKWVTDEEARYVCPECGHPIFRGAKRCHKCKVALDLD